MPGNGRSYVRRAVTMLAAWMRMRQTSSTGGLLHNSSCTTRNTVGAVAQLEAGPAWFLHRPGSLVEIPVAAADANDPVSTCRARRGINRMAAVLSHRRLNHQLELNQTRRVAGRIAICSSIARSTDGSLDNIPIGPLFRAATKCVD